MPKTYPEQFNQQCVDAVLLVGAGHATVAGA